MQLTITRKSHEKIMLLRLIEDLRQELIFIAKREGLTASKTISISKELDEYIHLYQMTYS